MSKLIQRKEYIHQLDMFRDHDLIKVITGLRRSGKSTLLELYQNKLNADGVPYDRIQSYNFEEVENYLGKRWDDLYQEICEGLQSDEMNYIFLDEIQNIESFEKLLDGLFVKDNVDLYVTGSNANMLSGELATLLSGRYVEVSILPLSFKEYLVYRDINTDDTYLNYELFFLEYVNETSLPKGVALRAGGAKAINLYVDSVYKTVVEKDVTQRHKLSNFRAFDNIIKYLVSNIGSEVSPFSISKALKQDGQNVHHQTVEKFLSYLEECYLFYKISRFDIRGKKQLATQEKYYLVDSGFRNLLVGAHFDANRGHILENIVYLELTRRGYQVWVGKYDEKQVDFIAKNEDNEIEYYQIAWSIADDSTREREFKVLESIKDNYQKFVLSADSYSVSRNGIKHLNVFDWLVGR